jgi:uncharacterized membrane protein
MDKQRKAFFHTVFRISILLKGIGGLLELISGFLLFFSSLGSLSRAVINFFSRELIEDRTDIIANLLIGLVQNFSSDTKAFIALYLVIDGLINVGLVVALWRKKQWAYPAAMVALSLFIVYQVYKLFLSFSYYLLFLTLIDIIIILLLRFEYKRRRSAKS